MKKHKLLVLGISIITIFNLVGCSSLKDEMLEAMNNNQEIKLSVDGTVSNGQNTYEWVELDQLNTFKNIRSTWDDKFQTIIFDIGSKNGVLFVDLNGNWAGNNILYNVFQNKAFINDFWNNNKLKSELAQAAIEQFSDINNESTGIIASVNAYFNIIPTNADGTSGLMNTLSRADAMAAIYRGDTPVIYQEIDKDFELAVYKNNNNIYAFNVAPYSYLKYTDGSLNYDTYNSPITRGEVIYILMNRYFSNELSNVQLNETFSDCKNAGNIAEKLDFTNKHAWESYELEYCLQNSKDGAPESIYKALTLAKKLGIISSDTRWNQPINGGELLNMMIKSYQAIQSRDDFAINAKLGANAGESLYVVTNDVEQPEITETQLETIQITEVLDVTDLDDLFAEYGYELDMTDEEIAEAYEIAENFTFEPCDEWKQVDHCYYLNVRTGPSTDYRILRSVPAGTKAHIVARCVENGWYRVLTEGKLVYQCGVYFSDFEGSDTYTLKEENNISKNEQNNDNIVDDDISNYSFESPDGEYKIDDMMPTEDRLVMSIEDALKINENNNK